MKRLRNDDNYVVIVDKPTEKEVDYENMLYNDLRQLAIEKGMNTYKAKKDELIKYLQDLEG